MEVFIFSRDSAPSLLSEKDQNNSNSNQFQFPLLPNPHTSQMSPEGLPYRFGVRYGFKVRVIVWLSSGSHYCSMSAVGRRWMKLCLLRLHQSNIRTISAHLGLSTHISPWHSFVYPACLGISSGIFYACVKQFPIVCTIRHFFISLSVNVYRKYDDTAVIDGLSLVASSMNGKPCLTLEVLVVQTDVVF